MFSQKSSNSDFWNHLADELDQKRRAGLARQVIVTEPLSPTTMRRNGHELLQFGSNDYLSLAWHPEVQATYRRLASQPRVGAGASPLVSGASPEYEQLARTIAAWEQTEHAVVYSSGYAANVGTLSAVAGREDLILSDALNHACLIDGCRLSRATLQVYPHADMAALDTLLRELRGRHRFAWIVTDTVFSMEGDLAPVKEIDALCRTHDAIAFADEAHASGVFGPSGRGVVSTIDFDPRRWIRTGTLSKAIGCSGGFVSGPNLLTRWLTHQARSWIYSTAMPAASLGAAARAIGLLQGMDAERAQLAERSRWLRRELTGLGLATRDDASPIVPVYFQDPHEVVRIAHQLLELGIYVPAIRPPTVPRNGSLLRISLNISHTPSDLGRLVEALRFVASTTPITGS